MLFLIWATFIIFVIYLYLCRNHSRFSKYGVKNVDPLPLIGNMGPVMLQKEHFIGYIERTYNAFRGEKFVGLFEFVNPILLVKDIELVKKITIQDFEHFLDHRSMFSEETEPILAKLLTSMKGQEWKDMRSTLSPAFTSSKMRSMLPLMVEAGERMTETIKNKIKESGVDYIDIDARDLTTRIANDVIASCAFGLHVNSLVERNNQFYQMGQEINNFSLRRMLTFFGYLCSPKIMNKLGLTLLPNKIKVFFTRIILSTMREREMKNIVRPDMIQLLMEAKKGKLTREEKTDENAGFATVEEASIGKKVIHRDWTDNDLVAQTLTFFAAGFETVSTCLSFAIHELAINFEVQEKLVEEINENKVKNNDKFDYSSIQNMKYMDMVVSEVLRLWPPAAALDRMCVKDYNVGKPNSMATEDYIIKKGEYVNIPVWSFHRDPEFFPEPQKFDPERYSEENKHKIKPFTYLPFGLGPRNCIGSRFALCEVKVILYQLLQHFKLSPCEKTDVTGRLSKKSIHILLEGGHWVRLKERKNM